MTVKFVVCHKVCFIEFKATPLNISTGEEKYEEKNTLKSL